MTIHQIAVFMIRLLSLGLAVAGASGLLALSQLLGTILAGGDSMGQSIWLMACLVLGPVDNSDAVATVEVF